jgi:hypothetical protein
MRVLTSRSRDVFVSSVMTQAPATHVRVARQALLALVHSLVTINPDYHFRSKSGGFLEQSHAGPSGGAHHAGKCVRVIVCSRGRGRGQKQTDVA